MFERCLRFIRLGGEAFMASRFRSLTVAVQSWTRAPAMKDQ